MTVTIVCPNLRCRSVLQVPEATRGRSVRCGKCGGAFLVPAKKSPVPTGSAESDAGKKGK